MIDQLVADVVEIDVDKTGKVWINVNGVCVLRIGHAKLVMHGRKLMYQDKEGGEPK